MLSPVAANFGKTLARRKAFEAQARREQPTLTEVWASRDWLVQVYVEDGVERLSINRTTLRLDDHRWVDGITWDELMEVKAAVGRGDRWAVEVYPPATSIVDVANMRHLFLLDGPPPYAWRKDAGSIASDDTGG